MKKNKTTQIVLIALVLIVWAGVAWQIFVIKKEAAPSNTKASKSQQSTKASTQAKPFSFELKANYSDPFLSTMHITSKIKTPSVPKFPPVKSPLKQKATIPNIKYRGYLFSKNQKRIILEINNNAQSYPINKKTGPVKVSFASKDSVQIYWNGQKKIIFRSY